MHASSSVPCSNATSHFSQLHRVRLGISCTRHCMSSSCFVFARTFGTQLLFSISEYSVVLPGFTQSHEENPQTSFSWWTRLVSVFFIPFCDCDATHFCPWTHSTESRMETENRNVNCNASKQKTTSYWIERQKLIWPGSPQCVVYTHFHLFMFSEYNNIWINLDNHLKESLTHSMRKAFITKNECWLFASLHFTEESKKNGET